MVKGATGVSAVPVTSVPVMPATRPVSPRLAMAGRGSVITWWSLASSTSPPWAAKAVTCFTHGSAESKLGAACTWRSDEIQPGVSSTRTGASMSSEAISPAATSTRASVTENSGPRVASTR